ncbi:MAG TPA: hypothetical protein VF727_12825 [Allosphingosinicella sp.]
MCIIGTVILPALLLATAPPPPVQLPPRPGECRTIRGRAFLTNGSPSVRIAVVGTKRILGVVQQDLTYGELPAPLRRAWDSRGAAAWQTDVFGDFTVCAVTRSRPGRMQLVRIAAARKLNSRSR